MAEIPAGLLRPALAGIIPYEPGKPVEEVQRELGLERVVKLACNEGPFGPFPQALEALERSAGDLNRYPDGGAYRLRVALAERHGVREQEDPHPQLAAGADFGAEIEFNARIGAGMFIAHPGGIVVGRGTEIGSNVTLFQGVTFGVKSWHPEEIRKFPRVGNSCFFFSHAAVLGGVTIGDCCVIGAHSVVTQDMPDGTLAIGVPALLI